MLDFITRLFDTQGFPPRWSCGAGWQEEPSLGWLHIASDLAIFGAYTAIPIVIAYFVLRRRDLPFPRVFWLFVVFIFACGTTHLISAIIFWKPIYRVDGLVKLITAVASWSTVAALIVATPKALRLPGLAKLNDELTHEVEERKQSEAALRQSETRLQENENRLQQALADREALLTSERSARSEAEHANRLKDEFLSVVSHELRTPLSAILGYSQLLQQGHVAPGEVTETYHAIERNGKAQVQIIDDLLDMSRIIAGKIRLDVRPVQLSEVIEAAVATIRPAADAKSIRLQQVLDPRSRPGPRRFRSSRADPPQHPFQRRQVHTQRGPYSSSRSNASNSHLEVSVTDSGAGILPEFLPHVFDRFRQAEGATTRRHGGLGLGLAIVKQLVELHGGTVTAKSPGENQGSTFTIALPLQAVQSTEPDRVHPQAESNSSAPYQVPDLSGVKVWSSTMSPMPATSFAASSPANTPKLPSLPPPTKPWKS